MGYLVAPQPSPGSFFLPSYNTLLLPLRGTAPVVLLSPCFPGPVCSSFPAPRSPVLPFFPGLGPEISPTSLLAPRRGHGCCGQGDQRLRMPRGGLCRTSAGSQRWHCGPMGQQSSGLSPDDGGGVLSPLQRREPTPARESISLPTLDHRQHLGPRAGGGSPSPSPALIAV